MQPGHTRVAGGVGLRRPVRGFTLLEIVIVVAIIGILVGFALISLPRMGGDAQLEEHVRRLTRLIELAEEEALLQGRDLGLYMDLHGYSFHVFDPDALNWVSLEADPIFRTREVPEDIEFELIVEGRGADLVPPEEPGRQRDGDSDGEGDDEEDDAPVANISTVRPQVLILASGELTAFTLLVESESASFRYIMTGQPYGAIELEEEELF
jgi:general secretion pathway protein H